MNLKDMEALGLKNYSIVNFRSHFKGSIREANNFKVVAYDIPKGCIGTYFPEANNLVHINNKAEISNTPSSKFIEVEIIIPDH